MEIKSLVSNTTVHEWCKNLDNTSRSYISKIKKNIQRTLIEKYSMEKTNHVIHGIDEMDELYYSKPENNVGSDNVFITPHLDGFLGWIPFMRCWRCIYCITNPNNTTNYFPLNKLQESIITLKPNNFICHDFNRDLHWIKPGIVEKYHESRIVLKLHFYDYPAFLKSFNVFYKNLNTKYNSFARNKFLYSIDPYKNILAFSLSFFINLITILGGYTEYFIGLVNIAVLYFIFKGVYKNKYLFFVFTESISTYMCVIQIMLGTVSSGTFWRDLLVYKFLSILYIYSLVGVRFNLSNISLFLLSITIALYQNNFKENTDVYYYHLNEFSRYHENKYNIFFHLFTSSMCYVSLLGFIQKKIINKPYYLPYLICGASWIVNKYSIPDSDCSGITTVLMTFYSLLVYKYKKNITYINCVILFLLGYALQDISHIIFSEPTYLSSYSKDDNKVYKFLIHTFWLLSFEIRVALNLVKV